MPVGDLIEASGTGRRRRLQHAGPGARAARGPPPGPRVQLDERRLEEIEQQRQSTLADVSHELRTPLTVIQGNVEALLDGVYPADREHLEPILEETRVMERLIEDLRTLTLAEAGRLVLHREPTDLGTLLLTDVAAGYRSQAEQAASSSSSRGRCRPRVDIDPARIREVVTNLLTNALRHTPSGGSVDLAARLTARKSRSPSVTPEAG